VQKPSSNFDDIIPKERIFAAVGIRITKPENEEEAFEEQSSHSQAG